MYYKSLIRTALFLREGFTPACYWLKQLSVMTSHPVRCDEWISHLDTELLLAARCSSSLKTHCGDTRCLSVTVLCQSLSFRYQTCTILSLIEPCLWNKCIDVAVFGGWLDLFDSWGLAFVYSVVDLSSSVCWDTCEHSHTIYSHSASPSSNLRIKHSTVWAAETPEPFG